MNRILCPTFIRITVCLVFSFLRTVGYSQVWQSIGPSDYDQLSPNRIINPSFVMKGDTPLVVFAEKNTGFKATVRKFNGTAWENLGAAGFSSDRANYTSIALDDNGTPYVVYQDYGHDNKATVMKFEKGTWEVVGDPGISQGAAAYTCICLHKNIPYVVFSDKSLNGKATVMSYNNGSWAVLGQAGISEGKADYTSLKFNDDTPFVVLQDSALGGKAVVLKFEGGIWGSVGNGGISEGVAPYPTIAFDAIGTPYIAYVDDQNGSKAMVKKFADGSWVTAGNADFSVGKVKYTNIAFNNNTPYVVYMDTKAPRGEQATVMKLDHTTWELVGAAGFSLYNADNTAIAFAGGIPYILFNYGEGGGVGRMMNFDGTNWNMIGPTGLADYSNSPELAFNGKVPYVAFLGGNGGGNGAVAVMKFINGAWDTVGVGGLSAVNAYSVSLAIAGTEPYLALSEATGASEFVAVRKFDGDKWVVVGAPVLSNGGYIMGDPIITSGNDIPYLAFIESGPGNKFNPKVLRYVDGDWEPLDLMGLSGINTSVIALACDGNTPYLAYADVEDGRKITVSRFENGHWVQVGETGFSGQTSYEFKIAINNHIPYVAFVNDAYKTTVMKFESPIWKLVGNETISSGMAASISMAFDDNGILYVANTGEGPYDISKVNVLKFVGNDWVRASQQWVSSGVGYNASIAFDGTAMSVVYEDNALFAKKLTAAVLPVQLIGYTAALQKLGWVKLQWTTISESNCKEFIISRSKDGENFTEIGRIPAVGNSSIRKDYVFYDKNPQKGTHYYRLEQVDINGNTKDYGIRAIKAALENVNEAVETYPNPVKNKLNIRFPAGIYNQIQLININGSVLQRLSVGTSDISKMIDLNRQATGIYFVRLLGKNIIVKKIMKQ